MRYGGLLGPPEGASYSAGKASRSLLRIKGNDELIDAAREKAEDRVLDVAMENGILQKAQENAEDSIEGLATTLGYQRVVFA